jgi:hypothetical protein
LPYAGEGYSYDSAGNLTADPRHSYKYDADGRRARKTEGVTTTVFVYSARGQLVAEYSSTVELIGTGTPANRKIEPPGWVALLRGEFNSGILPRDFPGPEPALRSV